MRDDRRGRHRAARWSGLVVALLLTVLLPVLLTPSAFAVPGDPGVNNPRTGPNTQLVMTGTGAGQGVSGGIAPIGSSFDPLAGYPVTSRRGSSP